MMLLAEIVAIGAIIFWAYQILEMITKEDRDEKKSKNESIAYNCANGDHSFSANEKIVAGMVKIICVHCGFENLIRAKYVYPFTNERQ